ncbi:DUF4258 domain-containing protein [Marinobacter halodurans]|uniref:DUF4258 domain-containing protein n=1 Tax=Marinobacter halodurans TaxID=2528979 RepID=A0ABY1ZLL2_9GAMM|nr:DUF4258 domain-containing protein [Marinobacter halodurans]
MRQCSSVSYTGHALRRMFERGLSSEEVVYVIQAGDMIMDYPDDRPYPSQLRLGWVNNRAIHVVVAQETESCACYVITAYYPTQDVWSEDFKSRRS